MISQCDRRANGELKMERTASGILRRRNESYVLHRRCRDRWLRLIIHCARRNVIRPHHGTERSNRATHVAAQASPFCRTAL